MPLYGKLMGTLFAGYSSGDSFAIDYLSDTIKTSLHTSSYAYNQDSDQTWANVTNEVTGTGYTARGQALTSKALAYNTSSNTTTMSADNPVWTSSTITARVAVVYKDSGTNSTSPLIAYFDFGSDQISSSGSFTIVWNASGIATFVVS